MQTPLPKNTFANYVENHLFNKSLGSDVAFVLTNYNNEKIPAHKIILARSPVFKAMFFDSKMMESSPLSASSNNHQFSSPFSTTPSSIPAINNLNNTTTSSTLLSLDHVKFGITVVQEEMSKTALLEFLRFLYTDKCELSGEIVFEVFDAAHKYQVTELEETCSKYLRDCVGYDNVFVLYSQSKMYGRTDLERKCLEFIEANCEELLRVNRQGVLDLSPDDLYTIVKNDHLEVNEYELFDACMAWSKTACEARNMEVTNENRRKLLGDIFFEIRFLSMDKEMFALKVVPKDILTKDETIDIFRYWYSNGKSEILKFNKRPREKRKKSFLIFGAAKPRQLQNIEAAIKKAADYFGIVYKVKSVNVAEPDTIPELEEMKQYDAALVFSDARFHDSEKLGTRLADFVDLGKGVVFCTFANCANNLQLKGRLVAEADKYLCVTVGPQKNLTAEKSHLMRKTMPEHPILEGVESLDAGIYRSKCEVSTIKGKSRIIGEWEDGVPMVAETVDSRVVVLNFFPVNSNYLDDCWKSSSDGDKVLFNSLLYVADKLDKYS